MTTEKHSILQAFQHFSPKCKKQFLQNSPNEIIRFLSECIVNLLHENLQNLTKEQVCKYRKQIQSLFLVRTTWKNSVDKKGLLLIKTISPFVIREHFVLVPISVYNSNIIKPTVVTKKELPIYQSEKKFTYQIESVKNDMNKNFFAKADSLVDKVLSSPHIKLSSYNFLILDGRDTGVSLTDFAQTLKRKNAEVPDVFLLYLMLLILHPAWF